MIQGRRVCPNNGFVLSLFNLFAHHMEEGRGRYERQIQTQIEMLPNNGKEFVSNYASDVFFSCCCCFCFFCFLHFGMIKLIFIKCPFL